MIRFLFLFVLALTAGVMIGFPALCIDQVIKLYICQTEHDLDEITSWEYSAPDKYREATKNGTLTPLDAARAKAGSMVAAEKIQCNSEQQVVIEEYRDISDPSSLRIDPLEGAELERYCPQTIKQYGNPCRDLPAGLHP